eukprot:scaffold930_cov193-Ochromonas_danica.AAC.1
MSSIVSPFDFPEDPCPFGSIPIDLSGRNLSASEKLLFGRVANKLEVRHIDLAKAYGVKYDLVNKWAKLYRLRALDSRGLLEARTEAAGQLGRHDYRAITNIVRNNYVKTYQRRDFKSINEGLVKLTAQSVPECR